MESVSKSILLKYIIQESYPYSKQSISCLNVIQVMDILINKDFYDINIIFENGFIITKSPILKTLSIGGMRFNSWEDLLDYKYLPINVLDTILFNLNEFRKL